MRPKATALALAAVLPLALAACTADNGDGSGGSSPSTTAPSSSASPAPSSDSAGAPDAAESEEAAATTVRFTAGETSIDVAMADNPAARDFLSMLPLTLQFEDFSGNEKISYLPSELDQDGTDPSILHQGDFLYYIPWGNVGFWYTDRPSHSPEDSLVLGHYDATLDELEALEGDDVHVEAVS